MTSEAIDSDADSELLDRSLTHDELDDLVSKEETPVSVTFATQDFDVAGLVGRLQKESMLVPQFGGTDQRISTAGFQRGFVWTKAQMDRFIESLLLGYPVPGIFLIRQTDNRMLVLDGQQRLVTLRRFYDGVHNGKEFVLSNVGDEFKGLSYKTLDQTLQFKLDDSFLQATIVAADGSSEVDDAIYQIFERLNSGGTQLTPHEIRVALYAGPLIDYLEDLNQDQNWRALYGNKSARIRDQELIMRILALFIDADEYAKPLKRFLNTFAAKNRQITEPVVKAGELFRAACQVLAVHAETQPLRRPGGNSPNVAQSEAILVGMMRAIDNGHVTTEVESRLAALKADHNFESATTRFTADKDTTSIRLELATKAFSG